MPALFNRFIELLHKIGVDKSIAYSSGSRIVNASAGIFTILFISIYLSKEEQGFYYTFGSIVALQVFFELGLTNILTQFIAHENAHIIWDGERISSGDQLHISRLAHLLQFTQKWYLIVSISFLLLILSGGIWFFQKYSPTADLHLWFIPWILVTTAASANLFLTPILAILSGVNRVKETSRIVFYQQLIMPLAIWLTMIAGGGLYVVGIGYWCSFVVGVVMIRYSKLWRILREINSIEISDSVSYKTEIFPYQWKIALSWASGYFVFQLFNPVLFATSGAVVAGQMGMTLAAVNGIASFSSSWISTKVPTFSGLIALRDYVKLDQLFNVTMKQLGVICSIMLLLFWVVIATLRYWDVPLAFRFLDLLPIAFLEIAILANQYGNGWATYLRCHKQEPLLVNSIVGAVTCGLSTLFLGKYFGALGMTCGYAILRVALTCWNYQVYKQKKSKWHTLNS